MSAARQVLMALILVLVLIISGPNLPNAFAENPEPLTFNWAFVGYSKGDNGAKLERIDEDISLKSGDKFKFFFEMHQIGYVYLIMLSSQSDIYLVYPNNLNRYSRPPAPTGALYLPAGNNWFQLDSNVGQERFYLLVSKNRLDGLEALLKNHEAAVAADKPALAQAILKKIRKLRWENRQFKSSAERPGLMMGRTRGVTQSAMPDASAVSDLAERFEAETFFSRTFTIDHK